MMLLFFSMGKDTYAVKCERVREVSPMVALKAVPSGSDCFAGLFHYRGMIIPVVDLCRVIQGHPCRMRLSTRIIIAEIEQSQNATFLLGLMAEGVTEAGKIFENATVLTSWRLQSHPYLSGVLIEDRQMIYLLDLDMFARSLPVLPSGTNG